MENMQNLWRGRFFTFTTPLGKPALAGEQVSHIDHITTNGLFSRRNGKKGRGHDIPIEKIYLLILFDLYGASILRMDDASLSRRKPH